MAEEKKRVRGREVKMVPKKEKEVKGPEVGVDGKVEAQELVDWFKKTYPEHQVVDRKNGISYHLPQQGKVVKIPTLENKGGVFFGARLNRLFKKLHDKGWYELLYHEKSNVWKVRDRISPELMDAIQHTILAQYPKNGRIADR